MPNGNENGLLGHCEVAALIIRELGETPHTRTHVRNAIRAASEHAIKQETQSSGNLKETAQNMSVLAHNRMVNDGSCENLVGEHVVPVAVLYWMSRMGHEELRQRDHSFRDTVELIEEIVIEWSIGAVITRDEHRRLTREGCYQKMPPLWYDLDDVARSTNKFSRYEQANITLIMNQNVYRNICG